MFFSRCKNFPIRSARNFTTENIIAPKTSPVEIPKIGLHEFVWNTFNKWANKTAALCFETQRAYTYNELYKRSLSVTHFLNNSLKFQNRETVGIILPNVPEYPIIFLAAIQAGLRVTTFNPANTSGEINRQLKDSHTRLIFTTRELLPLVRKTTDVPIVEISNDKSVSDGVISFEEISTKEAQYPVHNVDINDIIVLPYSSGTTGLPKGVQLSHFNLVANLLQSGTPEYAVIRENDVIPAFLPFFHVYGMVVIMLNTLVKGGQLLTVPKFSSDIFMQLLKHHNPSIMFGVPFVVTMANNHPDIKKQDLLKLQTFISGGSPLRASDIERFYIKTDNKVSLLQGCGMTEASATVMLQTEKIEHGRKNGGSGFLVSNTYGRVIPIDDSPIRNLGPGELGELVIKGPQVMQGYYNNPQANKDVFLEDGWLRTGDITYYDEHEHFFIVDRCKELIKVKGFQVPPAEIEALLRDHPNVADCGVVGVPHEILGEVPKAFVVVKQGHKVDKSNIESYVASKLSKHKHLLGGVVFVDVIPKNPSGKILRRELKKL